MNPPDANDQVIALNSDTDHWKRDTSGTWAPYDPTDRFDIPDEREPEHHIPDAVCDAQTPAGQPTIRELVDNAVMALNALVCRTICKYPPHPADVTLPGWMETKILDADITINQVQDAFGWVQDPDDDAYWAPPDPDATLSYDECEDAGLDGTLRDM